MNSSASRQDLFALLAENPYPGRGILSGLTPDGKSAVTAYFIMGRSENSRNRIFCLRENGEVYTRAFDESKVADPSLILYNAVRYLPGCTIVTNGDQTDTIYTTLKDGGRFEDALKTRCFEPDAPHFTPRISLLQSFEPEYTYTLSLLKSEDASGTACSRYTYSYTPVAGLGHLIHTYAGDGNPLPSFSGEPVPVTTENDEEQFAVSLWNALDAQNRISLFVQYTDLSTGRRTDRLIQSHI